MFKYEDISYKNELQLLSQNQEPWTNLIQRKIVSNKNQNLELITYVLNLQTKHIYIKIQ